MNRFDLRVAVLAVGAAVTLSALGACGGAASAVAPAQPPSGATDDSSTVSPEAALAAVDRAEAEIGRLLGGPAGSPAAPAASAAPMAQAQAAPMPPPPPPQQAGVASTRPSGPVPAKSAPSRREEHAGETEAPAARADSCSTACSALASMERAADHLCGLAGDTDARCQGARVRVKDAGARVHAACPACSR